MCVLYAVLESQCPFNCNAHVFVCETKKKEKRKIEEILDLLNFINLILQVST